MKKYLITPLMLGMAAFCGCRVVEVENRGEEIARDADGKPVLLQDGSIQTVKKGWNVYHNQHWMYTKADTIEAHVKPGEIDFALNGLISEPSTNLTALVDTSLKGAALLAEKIGAAIATSGGSVAADGVSGAVSAMISRYLSKGGKAESATVTCSDGSCTVTDGTVTESCTDCYPTSK